MILRKKNIQYSNLSLIYWANKVNLRKSAGQIERLSSLLAQSTIDLNPHQIHAVLFAFNSPLSRGAILADEVGLGKTIEAGLIIAQLWLEGKRRILIIVPASLRMQWREELETHFNLHSTVLDTKTFEKQINEGKPVPMTTSGIYIVSLPFVYRRIELIKKQAWDLVVIDEAHRLRRVYRGRDASKMAFELRKAISGKPKLLLTATPLQNNLLELYGLVSFIDDKLLGSKYFFKTRFIEKLKEQSSNQNLVLKKLRKIVLAPDEGSNFEQPEGVIVRTLRRQVKHYIPFPSRHSLTINFVPSLSEEKLYNSVSDYLRRPNIAAISHTQRNLMILVYRKLLASSSFAIAPTLKKLADRIQDELGNRKGKRGKKSTKDSKLAENIEQEELLEENKELEVLEEDIRGKILPDFSDEDLEKEKKELESYYELAISIKENTKAVALIKALRELFSEAKKKDWPQKVVIFTESRRTQNYLKGVLEENGFVTTVFNGSNNSKEAEKAYERWKKEFPELALNLSKNIAIREALIYDFKSRSQVFLTTEAGAEGINLQFANIVVNYDLPWNPQRIEQRIGRCHRYGQRYETIVVNMLNTRNYADKRVLELLQEKLNLFDGIFGSSDEILGALGNGIDFEKKILEIYQSCKTPEEIDAAFRKLQEELSEVRKKEIQSTKSKIIDYFDTPLLKLFRRTKEDVEEVLNDYDRSLLTLCQIYFGDKIQPANDPGVFVIKFKGKKKPYLFREEKNEEEIGKISRIHKAHPIIQHILNEVSHYQFKAIPVVDIQYSKSNNKVRSIDRYVGKEGMLYLFKLIVEGVETDEILAPLFFIKEDADKWQILTLEEGRFLIELPIRDTDETLAKSPLSKQEVLDKWDEWKKEILNRFEKRNQRLYVREQNRIDRYWDSYVLQNQDKIEKVEKEIKDLQRRRSNTIDFNQIRKLSKKIQQSEIRLQRLKLERTKLESKALGKKEKEFKELNSKLEFKKYQELLAIAKFKIV